VEESLQSHAIGVATCLYEWGIEGWEKLGGR
jgi:hypothetical protein